MKTRPILMSAPMVNALLAGRKTQTRRIIKPQPDETGVYENAMAPGMGALNNVWAIKEDGKFRKIKCPYGKRGDFLWCRETWLCHGKGDSGIYLSYFADKAEENFWVAYHEQEKFPLANHMNEWRPSIHMPRAASRLTLEITDIRAERLQAISDADAQAEGVFFKDYGRRCFHPAGDTAICPAPDEHHPQKEGWMWKDTVSSDQCLHSPRNAYGNLWASINGYESWSANPFVWVLSFSVHKQNVDELLKARAI